MASKVLHLLSMRFSSSIVSTQIQRGTDYGRPTKPFFTDIPNFWDWADKFWGIGVFLAELSELFWQ